MSMEENRIRWTENKEADQAAWKVWKIGLVASASLLALAVVGGPLAGGVVTRTLVYCAAAGAVLGAFLAGTAGMHIILRGKPKARR